MRFDLKHCTEWAVALSFDDIPTAVVEDAKNQILSMLTAIMFGYASPQGHQISNAYSNSRPLPAPDNDGAWSDPAGMAYLLSTWSMVHDFDDVMLGGHTGHSSVIVPLIMAWNQTASSGRDIIVAQVVANELAARFNIACALGQTRGQMASYLHLLGAAIARAKFLGMDAEQLSQVIAFTLASPGKLSMPAFLGSDCKFYCASNAVRVGWEAVDCVRAGLRPTRDIIDGPSGFFNSHAPGARADVMNDLGQQWYTSTNSYKLYPICGYISAPLDCALEIVQSNAINPDEIARVVLEANMFTCGVERLSQRYLQGADSSIATLTFSPSFALASALIHGEFTPRNLQPQRLVDSRQWQLREKIEIRHSMKQTTEALFKGIPTGVMLSRAPWKAARGFLHNFNNLVFAKGGRLQHWGRKFELWLNWWRTRNTSSDNIAELTKPLGCRLKVILRDGREFLAEQRIPRGFAGNGDTTSTRALLREKYFHAAEPLLDEQTTQHCLSIIERLEHVSGRELDRLNSLCFPNIDSLSKESPKWQSI
ncbi:MAG: hypothetical protein Tsb002_00370 [Wenzhouxiangellaceae bacterium]